MQKLLLHIFIACDKEMDTKFILVFARMPEAQGKPNTSTADRQQDSCLPACLWSEGFAFTPSCHCFEAGTLNQQEGRNFDPFCV